MKVILNCSIFIGAYLIGAIPTGAWLSQWYGFRDITKYGSGNIGATNVGRLLGITGFITVFLVDSFKACGYLIILNWLKFSEYAIAFAAVNLLIGNGCSIFLQGRGGKGVATSVGILLALAPIISLMSFFCWLLIYTYTQTVGIASVYAYACLPLMYYLIFPRNLHILLFLLFMSIWGIFRHRENIKKYIS